MSMADLIAYRIAPEQPKRRLAPHRNYATGERHGRAKLTDAQRASIPELLAKHNGNRSAVARLLGVSREIISREARRQEE